MTVKVEISLDVSSALAKLQATAAKMGNLSGVHQAIGEQLVDSTKQRFASSTAPDGSTWQALSLTTLERYVATFGKSHFGASGRLNKSGANRVMSRKPLVGESKSLSTQIHYEVSTDGNALTVGSPMVYAAVQQFGQKKGASGTSKRGSPIPWGDIPARPFLGLSRADIEMMERQYIASFGLLP